MNLPQMGIVSLFGHVLGGGIGSNRGGGGGFGLLQIAVGVLASRPLPSPASKDKPHSWPSRPTVQVAMTYRKSSCFGSANMYPDANVR